jgi:hypothetical protein
MKWLKSSETEIVHEIPFSVEQVKQAYRGKPNHCMCGCAGNYYYADVTKAEDWQLTIKEQDRNTRAIQNIYNKMKENANLGVGVIDGNIYTVVVGSTQYTIYLED